MQMRKIDLLIIGGGPAGLAAAIAAKQAGVTNLLLVERDACLGGILNQCIHNGFGLHTFKEELTGPEYAARYIKMAEKEEVPFLLNTIAVELSVAAENKDKIVTLMSRSEGMFMVRAKAVILAMGCRERPRGALKIPGSRPAGIYSAGTAQQYVNMEGKMPGKEIVILGSGDIGLIMARRMALEGAEVKLVVEMMPHAGGLKRNVAQCLNDFGIPLRLNHTIINIEGKERVESVTIAKVDENRKPIPGTEEVITCDTVLISCGLIPENELTRQLRVSMNPATKGPVVSEAMETEAEGVFACGNVLHVHDLVDWVSKEAEKTGEMAALYLKEGRSGKEFSTPLIEKTKKKEVESDTKEDGEEIICTCCPMGCVLHAKRTDSGEITITGNTCNRGLEYGKNEMINPKRMVTSTVFVKDSRKVLSVKTRTPVPKDKMMKCIEALSTVLVERPVQIGDVVIENVADTGVDVVATKEID